MKLDLSKYSEDDICDVYENRLCDNCGDCLFPNSKDSIAINIESIAKNLDENKYLEEEYKKMIEMLKEESDYNEEGEGFDFSNLDSNNSEYIDAFDNIQYIDDLNLDEDEDFDSLTEEIFPGVRKIKK